MLTGPFVFFCGADLQFSRSQTLDQCYFSVLALLWTLSQTRYGFLYKHTMRLRILFNSFPNDNFLPFQTGRKWQKVFQTGRKHCGEKDKLLVTSNLSFAHSVFKRLTLQTHKNQGLFGKGLKYFVNEGHNNALSMQWSKIQMFQFRTYHHTQPRCYPSLTHLVQMYRVCSLCSTIYTKTKYIVHHRELVYLNIHLKIWKIHT